MPSIRNLRALLLPAMLLATGLRAQEIISPLGMVPRPDNPPKLEKAGGPNEIFLYQNAGQTLPVIDDFSVDRTRHLNAVSGDANVHYAETIYRLVVGGTSTAGMAFLQDTSYHITVDTSNGELTITQVPNPAVVVVVRNLADYPPTEQSRYLWPPYTIIDTVGGSGPDTLALDPDIRQDSMLVYTVDPDPRSYINPDNSLRPWILWEDDDAYVNNTFPVLPPTIGVVTFDGMDRTGYPYLPLSPNTNGPADKLTSVPINLAYAPGDSVYLSFFCEPIGLSGDVLAHAEDSLHLDLWAAQEQAWYRVWGLPGTAPPDRFRQVMVPIKDPKFLKDGFRMRFTNDATLGGMVDQWHVDYVRLDRNRTYTDTVLKDVAFVYQEAGLLQTFTSVPFAKFTASPASYMAQQVNVVQRNNDTQDKFITWGYEVNSGCGWTAARNGYGNNISNNAYSNFNTVNPVNSGANPLVYDLSGCNGAAFVNVKFWTNATPDVCAYNDTMRYRQEISNYYSYDDGTAEAGYSLNVAGGKQAYRFDTQGQDSLRALRIYFAPIFTYNPPPNNYPPNGSFLITVWKSLDPEVVLFQNISFSSPQYRLWGPDNFMEYPLDSTIAVNGTFYVGWVQTNNTQMNVGMDKNRNNQNKMFYSVGQGWSQSGQQASWMIRPVMVAAVDPFAGVEETQAPAGGIAVWPNPVGDAFQLKPDAPLPAGAKVQLIDPMGRMVREWRADAGRMSVQDVAGGAYIVRLSAPDGAGLGQSRLIVQHGW